MNFPSVSHYRMQILPVTNGVSSSIGYLAFYKGNSLRLEMVRYLGIDYLHEAVASRRQLLSRCMLTVPQQLDQHNSGQHLDDKYRLPWTKEKPEKDFLTDEARNVAVTADALVQLTEVPSLKTETFSSVPYIDVDMVPSSNPDSPDIYYFDQGLSKWVATPDIITEIFEKEDLKQCHRVDLQIEMLSGENYLSETLRKLPTLSVLKDRLRPVHVRDPLYQDKHYGRADLRFSEDRIIPMLEQQYDGDLIHEKFESQFPVCQKMTVGELENVITPPSSQVIAHSTEDMNRLSKLLVSKEKLLVETENSTVEIIRSKLCTKQNHIKHEMPCYSSVQPGKISFLEVNDVVITDEDMFSEKAILPVPDDESVERGFKIPKLYTPSLDRIPLAETPERIYILNEKEKRLLMQKAFARERFCDEIQASRLPEPTINVLEDFSKDEIFSKNDPLNKAKETLSITQCTDIGQTELSLGWDIIKFGKKAEDPSKMLNRLIVEGGCGVQVKDVEKVEKYSRAYMHDWKDPVISSNEPSTHKKGEKESHCISKPFSIKDNEVCRIENKSQPKPLLDNTVKDSGVSKLAVALPEVWNDPLEDFVALRMNMFSAPARQTATTATERSRTEQPSSDPDAEMKTSLNELRTTIQGRKKIKHHIVSVKLSDAFQQVLDLLADKASYMIQALKSTGDLSQSSSFEILTPDMTRFLLKQKEKQIKDENGAADETYRNIVGLHALSGAADIIANCCLESGIAHISAVQEKYCSTLKGVLNDVRQKLFEIKARFNQMKVHHPKVATLCKEIEIWLKKKRIKSGDSEQKILVLIKRDLSSLLKTIKTVLSLGNLLIPEVLTSSSSEDIIKSLDEHNCLLAYIGLVDDHFPWAQFCLVVEYEHQSDSVWKDHCKRQNIRHIALKLDTQDQQDAIAEAVWSTSNPSEQITLIASQNITKNIELLQILEARHNILLIERDYSLIEGCQGFHFPDLDVDEGCGIVLTLLTELKDDCTVQALVTKILALSLKLVSCWILLYSDKPSCYQFPGIVVTNLSRLDATIANLSFKRKQLEVKLLTCANLTEVAGSIRSISENHMTANRSRDVVDWLSRDWLAEEISQGEKFLMMMPSITSFNAQLMLKSLSLKELLSFELQELSSVLPWVPEKILQQFLAVTNKEYGIHLQGDNPDVNQEEADPEDENSSGEIKNSGSCIESLEECNDAEERECMNEGAENRTEIDSRNGHKIQKANWEVLADTNSCDAYSISSEADIIKVSEMKNHNSSDLHPYSAMKAEEFSKARSDEIRKQGEFLQIKCNADFQMRRNSKFLPVSNCKTKKEDWLLLESFIKDKNDSSTTENVNTSSFQSCRNDYCREVQIHGNTSNNNDFYDKSRDESKLDVESFTLHNKHIMKVYQENDRKYETAFDQTEFPKNRNDMSAIKYYPLSQNINRNRIYEANHLNIKTLDRKSLAGDICQNSIEGFSHAEIERCVNEDLENFVNRRFAHPSHFILPNSVNFDYSGMKADKWNDNAYTSSDDRTVRFNAENRNRKFDQRVAFPPMEEKNPVLPDMSSQFTSESNADFHSNHKSLHSLLQNDTDQFNIWRQPTTTHMGLRDHLHTGSNLDKSKYFLNDIDTAVNKNSDFKRVDDGTNFPQGIWRENFSEPLGELKYNENFDFRPYVPNFDGNWYDSIRFNEEDIIPRRTVRSDIDTKRNSVTHTISNPSDLFYATASGIYQDRRIRFDYEPNNRSFLSPDADMERKANACSQSTIIACEDVRQLSSDSRIPVDNVQLNHGGNFYINPNIERLSNPPQFKDVQSNYSEGRERSLEDDLRETTRKLLANSQQFSRFSGTSSRRPMQKLNIGLAVPLHRDNLTRNASVHPNDTGESAEQSNLHEQSTSKLAVPRTSERKDTRISAFQQLETTDEKKTATGSNVTKHERPVYERRQRMEPKAIQEQKLLMKQSPWATEDSPPMDLNYDEELSQREIPSRNRAVFTSQTPQKKRKLTYEVVPGKKGQTRLVFQ